MTENLAKVSVVIPLAANIDVNKTLEKVVSLF